MFLHLPLGIIEPALLGVMMRTGMKAIGVMLASSAFGGNPTFISAFVLTNVLVMGNETIVTKVKIQH